MNKQTPKTIEEARQYAIVWQQWFSENSLSYNELVAWQCHFGSIASRFNLIEEFKENGVI